MSERRYGWVMVALGAFMSCIAVGAMFSLAVFLRSITEATGWSNTEVSTAMTLNFLAMGAAGFGWGWLSDEMLAIKGRLAFYPDKFEIIA